MIGLEQSVEGLGMYSKTHFLNFHLMKLWHDKKAAINASSFRKKLSKYVQKRPRFGSLKLTLTR